jgi:hypothetical protein
MTIDERIKLYNRLVLETAMIEEQSMSEGYSDPDTLEMVMALRDDAEGYADAIKGMDAYSTMRALHIVNDLDGIVETYAMQA